MSFHTYKPENNGKGTPNLSVKILEKVRTSKSHDPWQLDWMARYDSEKVSFELKPERQKAGHGNIWRLFQEKGTINAK